jgi:hypothetical protein
MTVATKPGHRGEHEISRKTIARGMPGCSGVTVVTNSRVFFYTRGCGRIERPAFPAPSDGGGQELHENLALTCGEIAKLWLAVIARSDLSAVAQRAKAEATKRWS